VIWDRHQQAIVVLIQNAGIVITDRAVVLIDALGTPALAEELMQAIRRITQKPITDVIVTHYHADHYYGLQVFKQQGARIIRSATSHASDWYSRYGRALG